MKKTVTNDHPWSPVRLRVSVFVERESHALCVYDPVYRNGGWFLPGGAVEQEETLVDGAVREVFEETGIRVSIERLFLFRELLEHETEYERTYGATRKTLDITVTGTYLEGTATSANNPSIKADGINRVKEVRWLSFPEFETLVLPNQPFFEPLIRKDAPINDITVPLNRIYKPIQDLR